MRYRRRRRDQTPAEKKAAEAFDKADIWLSILGMGIGEALKRGCDARGYRIILDFAKCELPKAIDAHDEAQQACDALCCRPKRVTPKANKKKKP